MPEESPLDQLQQRTFARSTEATRRAYPAERQLAGPRLTGYLERRALAVVGSTRPDGRPHSAISSYIRRGTTFWLPTVAGSVREGNIRACPWLVLVVVEGEDGEHIAVIVEGAAVIVAPDAVPRDVATEFGKSWVASWLRLDAERLLSYADTGAPA